MDDFLIGSYIKNTQIRPRSDIDIFVVLDSHYYTEQGMDTPRKVFGLLLRNLRKTYPNSKIRSDGQAVTIEQSGRFKIDVIPAYLTSSNAYIIPNQRGQTWIPCNPKSHVKYLTDWNQTLNGRLKPLIKMVKVWSKLHEVSIKSFHLELLVTEAFKSLTTGALNEICSNYPRALTHIFQQGCILIDNPFYDEMNERVDEYLNNGNLRTITWNKLQTATEISTRALHLQQLDRDMFALGQWRRLFKSYFPR